MGWQDQERFYCVNVVFYFIGLVWCGFQAGKQWGERDGLVIIGGEVQEMIGERAQKPT